MSGDSPPCPYRQADQVCVALLLCLLSIGCNVTRYSETLTEEGVVEQTVFTPSTHGTGTGIDMTGKGGISIVSVSTSPVWATVFRCQHGKFIIYGQGLWERMHGGQTVTISYREVYRCPRKEPDKCALVDYDFLDAVSR